MRRTGLGLALIALATLIACENRGLRNVLPQGDGPDEFIIVPSLPLETPTDFSSLPTPTPGQANLTDQQPLAESAAALGGRRVEASAVPSSDSALVSYASRSGVSPTIRADLAAADAKFRKRQGRFAQIRLAPTDRYYQAYRREALNSDRIAAQYRASGFPTPSAPPDERRGLFD